MKLCIWYSYTERPYGGSNNFLRRLGSALSKLGHDIVFGYRSGFDAVLINAFIKAPDKYLLTGEVAEVRAFGRSTFVGNIPGISHVLTHLKKGGPLIAHRVDGVTQLYGRATPFVDALTVELNKLTDVTIFQSEFCRSSFCNYGMRSSKHSIIHNGVPHEVFYPKAPPNVLDGTLKLVASSWSSNPLKGFSTLARLSRVRGVTVTFIGNWPSSANPEGVLLCGPRTEGEIAEILRNHHGFVHAAINEPSSNSIIEALASGLPVLYKDSGGNKELVGNCGLPLDSENLCDNIEAFRHHYGELRELLTANLSTYSIDNVAKQYVSVISSLL